MKFKADKPNSLQALFGLSNSKAGFKNNYFSIFMRDSGEIGVEIRDAQKGINYYFLDQLHYGESIKDRQLKIHSYLYLILKIRHTQCMLMV